MAKRKASTIRNITPERAGRLYRLLKLLGKGAQTRANLIRRLRFNIRGFYRDLEVLRAVGIAVVLVKGHYHLEDDAEDAIALLPFPDPGLSVGEARLLSKGKSAAHKKIRTQLGRIER
jgi:predicted DNA-binding transcriptional regulator YafY